MLDVAAQLCWLPLWTANLVISPVKITWGYLKIKDPQVTTVVSILSHSLLTWMIWGVSPILWNLHMLVVFDLGFSHWHPKWLDVPALVGRHHAQGLFFSNLCRHYTRMIGQTKADVMLVPCHEWGSSRVGKFTWFAGKSTWTYGMIICLAMFQQGSTTGGGFGKDGCFWRDITIQVGLVYKPQQHLARITLSCLSGLTGWLEWCDPVHWNWIWSNCWVPRESRASSM